MIKRVVLLVFLFPGCSMANLPEDFWRLRYDERGIPLTDVKIDNRLHALMLDTGSGEGLHLYQYELEKLVASPDLTATRQDPRRLIDVTGGESQVSAWKIQRLFISGVPFDDIDAVSFKPWGLSMGSNQPVNEVLGLGLFHDRRVLLDFKNNRLQMLKHLPANIGDWLSWPVEKAPSGLRITASIGGTPLHLIVDTGASHSLLFSDRLPAGTLFTGCRTIEPEASDLDCRVTKMTLTDDRGRLYDELAIVTNKAAPEAIDFDGLLGMKFMQGRQVIIDMPEGRLWISR